MLQLPLPLHLAVHLVGLAVAGGLIIDGWRRRELARSVGLGIIVAGVLLGVTHGLLGALVFDDGAGPLLLRAGAYASLGVAATGVSVLPVVLVAPIGTRLLTAVVGGLAAAATGGGVLGRGRAVLPLVVGLLGWAAADLVAGSLPTVAAGLSIAGSIAVGAWLLRGANVSLAGRITAGAVGVLLLVVLVLASGAGYVFDRDLTADRLDRLDRAGEAQIGRLERDVTTQLSSAADVFGATPSLVLALTTGEGGDALAQSIQEVVMVPDLVLLLDVDGRVVGSYDRRAGAAIGPAETTLAGTQVVVTSQEQLTSVADLVQLELEDGANRSPELLAVAADVVFADEDRRDVPVGTLVVAQRLTTAAAVARIAEDTGVEVAVLAGGRLAATTGPDDESLSAALESEGAQSGTRVAQLNGTDRFVAVRDLRDASGTAIGALVLSEPGGVVADLESVVARTLFLAALLGGLLAVGLVLLVTRQTTQPLRELTGAAERIAGGDLDVRVDTRSEDEVGRLGSAFTGMTSALRSRDQELRQAATEQRELREQLESVTAAMGEALLAVDSDGVVIMANPAAQRLLDLGERDPMGCALDEVLQGRDDAGQPLVDVLGRPDARTGTSVRGQVIRASGPPIAVAATAAPLTGEDGTPAGRVLVLRDIDVEAQVDRMKTEFLSNISHELRTPLTPIRAYAQILQTRPDLAPERVAEFAATIALSTARLERIIGMLVDFAALQAGRVEIDVRPISVEEAVEAARDRWRDRAGGRTIRRRLAKGLPAVLADPALLDRVLDEFIDNALKFSTGDITVTASPGGSGGIVVGVSDHGDGMDDATLASLGDDFSQADGSATRAHGGLGLGLSIVARIAEELDGEIQATSDPGRPTHVGLLLPAAHSDGP